MNNAITTDARAQVLQDSPAIARPRPQELRFPLSPEQLHEYRTRGFIILPGFFSAEEVRLYQAEADRLYARADLMDECNLRMEYNATTKKNWKIDPFVDISEVFMRMTRHPKLVDVMASIYDGYAPRLFKDKLIYKPPHTGGNGMHQDYNWWQGFPKSLLSVAIALDPSDASTGCTELFPYGGRELLTTAGVFENLPESKVDLTQGVKFLASPGDVAIFTAFVPHRAAANTSERFRRQIFLSYNDSRDGEFYQMHYEHFRWYRTYRMSAEQRAKMFFR